ncbi:glycosyltransferase [Kitasatospora griseola]|uniref:glycosyltransferase n=1 Tax=Kitasatospora griseola TaxID=2064 RepID=UPI00381B1714
MAIMVSGLLGRASAGPGPGGGPVAVSQVAVLRRATAFVSHAGLNSALEALRYGVGLVAVPQAPEQAANAARLVELGLGERLGAGTVGVAAWRRCAEPCCGVVESRVVPAWSSGTCVTGDRSSGAGAGPGRGWRGRWGRVGGRVRRPGGRGCEWR